LRTGPARADGEVRWSDRRRLRRDGPPRRRPAGEPDRPTARPRPCFSYFFFLALPFFAFLPFLPATRTPPLRIRRSRQARDDTEGGPRPHGLGPLCGGADSPGVVEHCASGRATLTSPTRLPGTTERKCTSCPKAAAPGVLGPVESEVALAAGLLVSEPTEQIERPRPSRSRNPSRQRGCSDRVPWPLGGAVGARPGGSRHRSRARRCRPVRPGASDGSAADLAAAGGHDGPAPGVNTKWN